MNNYSEDEYPFTEGDTVCHITDTSLTGTILLIDRNLPHPTTCNVLWDHDVEIDIQWTNKLMKVE